MNIRMAYGIADAFFKMNLNPSAPEKEIIMQREKGQSLVEFAFVFPFVIMLIFAIIYSGMLFYDYSTLSNLARSSTREAAIEPENHPGGRYTEIENRYKEKQTGLTTSLYQTAGADYYKIEEDADRYITTTITMALPNETSYVMRMVLPQRYSIRYYMRKEFTKNP